MYGDFLLRIVGGFICFGFEFFSIIVERKFLERVKNMKEFVNVL